MQVLGCCGCGRGCRLAVCARRHRRRLRQVQLGVTAPQRPVGVPPLSALLEPAFTHWHSSQSPLRPLHDSVCRLSVHLWRDYWDRLLSAATQTGLRAEKVGIGASLWPESCSSLPPPMHPGGQLSLRHWRQGRQGHILRRCVQSGSSCIEVVACFQKYSSIGQMCWERGEFPTAPIATTDLYMSSE